jgi:hypothetical protein
LGDVFSSRLTAYALIRDAMESKGYHIAIDPRGSSLSSGHTIYKESKPQQIPGITFPQDYTYLKPISPGQLAAFSGVLQDTINQQLETVDALIEREVGYTVLDPHTWKTITNQRQ